jgi:ubiquinone/menaquinone biosynthesis C-methylase UbiE
MELSQAIKLIKHPIISKTENTIWADLGSGSGLFTNALAHLLASGSTIYAVDKNTSIFKSVPGPADIRIEKIKADFVKEELPFNNLDGILMANSLHYVQDKTAFIKKAARYLNEKACLLIIEYDTDTPNTWVPYPLSFHSLQELFAALKYSSINKIHEIPSQYGRRMIYSAIIKN